MARKHASHRSGGNGHPKLDTIKSTDSASTDDLSEEMRYLEQDEREEDNNEDDDNDEEEMNFENDAISCKTPAARISGRKLERGNLLSTRQQYHVLQYHEQYHEPHPPQQHQQRVQYYQNENGNYSQPPPPPPSAPPTRNAHNHNHQHQHQHPQDNDARSTFSTRSNKTTHTNQTSATNNQEQALITLLKQMRSMEQQLQKATQTHERERSIMKENVAKQARYISILEKEREEGNTTSGNSNGGTNNNNVNDNDNSNNKKALKKIFHQLDNFANGCSKFPSASVKKMSEALHHQVKEWSKLHHVVMEEMSAEKATSVPTKTSTTKSSTTIPCIMEKMQSLHLEIRELKQENHALKKRIRTYDTGGGGGSSSGAGVGSSSGSISGGGSANNINTTNHANNISIDYSDEVSQFSGMTSTTRMMDAMSGFLKDHDQKTTTPPRKIKTASVPSSSILSSPPRVAQRTRLPPSSGSSVSSSSRSVISLSILRRDNGSTQQRHPSISSNSSSNTSNHASSSSSSSVSSSSTPYSSEDGTIPRSTSRNNSTTTSSRNNSPAQKTRPKKVQMNITPQILSVSPRRLDHNNNHNIIHQQHPKQLGRQQRHHQHHQHHPQDNHTHHDGSIKLSSGAHKVQWKRPVPIQTTGDFEDGNDAFGGAENWTQWDDEMSEV